MATPARSVVPHRPTVRTAGLVPPWYRQAGPLTVVALVAALAALWVAARPDGVPTRTFVGQLVGAEAVLLMSVGLVLVSTLPWVEHWFDGIDRAAIWHRRVVIAGLVLLAPHGALAANASPSSLGPAFAKVATIGLVGLAAWSVLPRWRALLPPVLHPPADRLAELLGRTPGHGLVRRLLGGYERWRAVHRLTGLLAAVGFAHGLLDATTFGSPVLRWTYVAVAGAGVAFYLYRELLARRFMALHDYQVSAVTTVAEGLTEIELRPLGRRLQFLPGQFAMVYLEARDGWHRHPFTIASAAADERVRFTVKALGDWSGSVADLVDPGMPAVIGGPHGRFTHTKGTEHQVWVAGGVGVTPFLSWLRSLDTHPVAGEVDFFYTSAEVPVPYAEEILAIAKRHQGVRVHVVRSAVDGRLTAERVLAEVQAAPEALSVFLCGPEPLVESMTSGLHDLGVPFGRFHREYFDWR